MLSFIAFLTMQQLQETSSPMYMHAYVYRSGAGCTQHALNDSRQNDCESLLVYRRFEYDSQCAAIDMNQPRVEILYKK